MSHPREHAGGDKPLLALHRPTNLGGSSFPVPRTWTPPITHPYSSRTGRTVPPEIACNLRRISKFLKHEPCLPNHNMSSLSIPTSSQSWSNSASFGEGSSISGSGLVGQNNMHGQGFMQLDLACSCHPSNPTRTWVSRKDQRIQRPNF